MKWEHSRVRAGGREDRVHGRTLKTVNAIHAGQAALGWSDRMEAPQTGKSPVFPYRSKPISRQAK